MGVPATHVHPVPSVSGTKVPVYTVRARFGHRIRGHSLLQMFASVADRRSAGLRRVCCTLALATRSPIRRRGPCTKSNPGYSRYISWGVSERVESVQPTEFSTAFAVHDFAPESSEGVDELGLGIVRLHPQVPPNPRRPNHRTCYICFVDESHSFTVRFSECFEDASGLFADTEVVAEKWNDERGCVATPRVLDALSHGIHIIGIHVNIHGQKRVHARIRPEFTLYSSEESLCGIDIVLILEEPTEGTGEFFDIYLTTLLLTEHVIEVE